MSWDNHIALVRLQELHHGPPKQRSFGAAEIGLIMKERGDLLEAPPSQGIGGGLLGSISRSDTWVVESDHKHQ